jgi:hypothetical protein
VGFQGPEDWDIPRDIDGLTGRLGTPAEVAAKPRVFTVVGRDRSRSSDSSFSVDTRRELRITFRPVELRFEALSSSPLTVLHRGGFTGRFFPPWATARSYTWQMKRAHQSQWTTLGTRRLEVRFPSASQILADQNVNSFIQDAWTRTLLHATMQTRREFGFWISLDTCHRPRGGRRYNRTTPMLRGRLVGPTDDASVRLGPRPPDDPPNPPAAIGCAEYQIANLHTHTPTTYREPPGASGHPKEKPAILYQYGVARRPTPQR